MLYPTLGLIDYSFETLMSIQEYAVTDCLRLERSRKYLNQGLDKVNTIDYENDFV